MKIRIEKTELEELHREAEEVKRLRGMVDFWKGQCKQAEKDVAFWKNEHNHAIRSRIEK